MELKFSKFHGAGNDFILVNNLDGKISLTHKEIYQLCHRRFGIGADGLMLLKEHNEYDFEMQYFNSDGLEGSMCGNGGRCIVAFAHMLGVVGETARFIATDGEHHAEIISKEDNLIQVKLEMQEVTDIQKNTNDWFLDTGSPHYVEFVENLDQMDVYSKGKAIRNSARFALSGTNVNFVEIKTYGLDIRTFERGVEEETWACGTGATAAALAYADKINLEQGAVLLKAPGGNLKVSFSRESEGFNNIWLEGPAQFVFEGIITL